MKNKTKALFACSIICTFFIGVIATYLLIRYLPFKGNKIINENISKVTVDEKGISASIEKLYDAVVVVESYKGLKNISTGTGFVYKKDDKSGYIVTNNHVIDSADKVVVTFTNKERIESKVLGKDSLADIAVLSVPQDKVIKVADIGKSEESKLGDTVFTIGAPMGSAYSGTVTRGILSGKDRMVTVSVSEAGNDWIMKAIQTDAAINPGNSGGPLANINGEVIGINSLKLVQNEIEGMGFAIPMEDAMRYIEILEKGKSVDRPFLGITMIDASDTYQLYLNGLVLEPNITEGVVIESVSDNSPAVKAGLARGDVITSIEGVKIKTKAELRYELYKNQAGDKIKVKYYRKQKEKETSITLSKQS